MSIYHQDSRLRVHKVVCGPYSNNAFVITCAKTGDSVIVDTPAEPEKVLKEARGSSVRAVLITHNHADHLAGFEEIKAATGAPAAIHPQDAHALPSPPEFYLNDGDIIPVGQVALRVLHTPGHTPGSACLYLEGHLFVGDTLFPGGPGRTTSLQNLQRIIKSITEKLFPLPDDTRVYTGHGDETTIGKAKEEYAIFASRPHPPELCGDVLWLSS